MSDHYFSERPTAAHDRKELRVTLRGTEMSLTTDASVFSRNAIDFGSRLLIDHMRIATDDSILDIGCGYGVIGLVAATLAPNGQAVLLDMNERAVDLARENAARNRITNVTVIQSDLCAALNGQTFRVIVTNPPIRAGKAVVHRLFDEAYRALQPGGSLWVVIQKKQGAPSAIKKLEEQFSAVDIIEKNKGYYILRAQKT